MHGADKNSMGVTGGESESSRRKQEDIPARTFSSQHLGHSKDLFFQVDEKIDSLLRGAIVNRTCGTHKNLYV